MAMTRSTQTIDGLRFDAIDFNALVEQGKPCLLKGVLNDSALVQASRESDDAAMIYLQTLASDKPILSYLADADAHGRFFYNEALDGFNFSTEYSSVAEFFQRLRDETAQDGGAAVYVGSAELAVFFPELLASNDMQMAEGAINGHTASIGIWMGNKTTAATHFDVSNNIAVCMAGRRRFTLFPPENIENLYPGPLEPTPGGQVVSMVDLRSPDLERYPRAAKALQQAETAELEAGDVLVYPAMWWHNVEALDDFNVLINYWWNTVPGFIDDPMNTLLHGLLSLRDRPAHEKKAWRAMFDYYVFGDSQTAREHLPENIQGSLAALDHVEARRLRAKLLNKFNR